jgi:hypothetical protein
MAAPNPSHFVSDGMLLFKCIVSLASFCQHVCMHALCLPWYDLSNSMTTLISVLVGIVSC